MLIITETKNAHFFVSKRTWFVLLLSESPSGMCTMLHTVAASNNRDHMPQ